MMVHRLFEDFLDNPDCYAFVEQYWKNLVHDAELSVGQDGEWQPWIPRHYADGTPFELDGNPIFDGRSKKLNRAFKILQHPSVGNGLEIVAWLKTYEKEYSDLPHEELVINLSLSQESARVAKELLIKWMAPDTTAHEMQLFIPKHLALYKET
jgi:hypothetical protein